MVAIFTFLNKPSVPIPLLLLCVLVPPDLSWVCEWSRGCKREGSAGPAPEEPGSASRCCHPRSIPSCLPAGVWLPIPSHPVSSHRASSCSIPSHTAPSPPRDVTPQRGEPQTPPEGRRAPSCAGGAHRDRDPVGSLTRLPRAQTGAGCPQWPADVCRAAAGSQLRHVWLCPVSPGTDPGIPCSWLFVLSANCWHAVAAAGPCAGSGDAKPQASVALGTHPYQAASLQRSPQIPAGCWQ